MGAEVGVWRNETDDVGDVGVGEGEAAHARRETLEGEPGVGHHARAAGSREREQRGDRVRFNSRRCFDPGFVKRRVDDSSVLHVGGEQAERDVGELSPADRRT